MRSLILPPPSLPSKSQSVHRGPKNLWRLLSSVVYQDPVTDLDAFITDVHPPGSIRRIRDECIYLVLGFAAKRTSDFILFVALGKHDPSMPREWWKSRFAKVLISLLIGVRLPFQRSIERCCAWKPKDRLPSVIISTRLNCASAGLRPSWRGSSSMTAPVFFLHHFRRGS